MKQYTQIMLHKLYEKIIQKNVLIKTVKLLTKLSTYLS